jgi:hypothetical protein
MRYRRIAAVIIAAVSIATLTGCAAAVAVKTNAPVVAAPSATPTPTPVATGPTLRVHTTCDELMPAAIIQPLTGANLSPVAREHTMNPTGYGNARVGSLECEWSNGKPSGADGSVTVYVTVAPDATRDGFEYFLNGESGGGTPSTVGPDTYLVHPSSGFGGFFFLTSGYGASGYIVGGAGTTVPPTASQSFLKRVYGIVSALPAPDSLWKPTPDLRGTTNCDGLATADQLAATVGLVSARVSKSDDGEYSTSLFDVDRQVGGYNCIWTSDGPSNADARVAVLPGGAVYASQVRTDGARDISGLGDSAFIGGDGDLNVIAADGWVQVGATGATDDQLVALAQVVLTNNGYVRG